MNMPTRQVHRIGLDLIDDGNRLRPVDADYVALIAGSMAERGLDTPVIVTGAGTSGLHRLIAGGHRVAAARALDWPAIDAVIVEADELQAKLIEIDENLIRRELSALDRAVFLAERKDVYLALHPETGTGKAKKNKDKERSASLHSFAESFDKATAKKLGLDPSTIRRAVARAALDPALRRALAGHPVAESGSELDKLLGLPLDRQRAVVAALTRAEAPARNVSAALAEVAGPNPTSRAAETQRQLAALLGAWRKAGTGARSQFLDFLASERAIPERPAKPTTKPKGGKA